MSRSPQPTRHPGAGGSKTKSPFPSGESVGQHFASRVNTGTRAASTAAASPARAAASMNARMFPSAAFLCISLNAPWEKYLLFRPAFKRRNNAVDGLHGLN
jgi:hypothetical protein